MRCLSHHLSSYNGFTFCIYCAYRIAWNSFLSARAMTPDSRDLLKRTAPLPVPVPATSNSNRHVGGQSWACGSCTNPCSISDVVAHAS